jgi:hypothetical protein
LVSGLFSAATGLVAREVHPQLEGIVYESKLSQEELAGLVKNELSRLARGGELDLRSELEHHIWPVLKEVIAKLESVGDDEAVIPAELAGRVAAIVVHLLNAVVKAMPAEEYGPLASAANETIAELLEYVDEDEWAALTRDVTTVQSAEPASPSSSQAAPTPPAPLSDPPAVPPAVPVASDAANTAGAS